MIIGGPLTRGSSPQCSSLAVSVVRKRKSPQFCRLSFFITTPQIVSSPPGIETVFPSTACPGTHPYHHLLVAGPYRHRRHHHHQNGRRRHTLAHGAHALHSR